MSRPTGCVMLGAAIRTVREARGCFTQDNVAFLLDTYRSRIAQWETAHRAITARELDRLCVVLDINVTGVNRRSYSAHHEPVCKVDLGEGPFVVTCRSTGNVLYPVPTP